MTTLRIHSTLGVINLLLLPSAAPITVSHISLLTKQGLFNNINWYRSDFVIQTGLYGTSIKNPNPDLSQNETKTNVRVSNTRGTVAIAHHDVPDNGNSEFFINLGANTHLDEAYGGYCVFARIAEDDVDSFKVTGLIADEVKVNGKVGISRIELV